MIMIFGVVLAGGIGSRMGNVDKPKQYLLVGEKPIIIHTLEKFYVNDKFDRAHCSSPGRRYKKRDHYEFASLYRKGIWTG